MDPDEARITDDQEVRNGRSRCAALSHPTDGMAREAEGSPETLALANFLLQIPSSHPTLLLLFARVYLRRLLRLFILRHLLRVF